MKPIPLLFKRKDGNGPLTETPTNLLAKAILDGAPGWVPRRELEAKATFLLDNEGKWFQYRVLKPNEKKIPDRFVEMGRSKKSIVGWVPYTQGSARVLMERAISEGGVREVRGSTYALVDTEEGWRLIRPEDAEVCEPLLGVRPTFKMLKSLFLESLEKQGWIGVVWWGPNGETLRLGVSDFG